MEVLQELSKQGISLNDKDAFGNSPATRAAGKGHIGVIRELVKHQDVDLNACDGLDEHQGFNPPTIAVVQGQVDMVAELSRQGANLGDRDGWGYTPAAWAATWGDTSTIRELAKQKVDLNATCQTHFSSEWEITPAAIAARAGHVPVLEELRQQGIDLLKPESNGSTPADIAKNTGDHAVVQYMTSVESGEVHQKELRRWWFQAVQESMCEVMRGLLKSDPTLAALENHSQQTAATMAAAAGNREVVCELFGLGVDLGLHDTRGYTPASQAAAEGMYGVLQELHDRGVGLKVADGAG